MPSLKGNLHTHTTLSDGIMSPAEVVTRYREAGYDFVAFTDHRFFVGDGEQRTREYWAKLPQPTDDFVILYGVEEEPPEINGRHLGVIRAGGEELRILNHPNEYRMSVDDVVDAVAKVGAHAIEITCHGRYLDKYDVPQISAQKVATDDAHFAAEIGVSCVLVEAERNAEDILRAIKAGRFQNHIGKRR